MTVDEALTWARATDNERWQLLTETRDKDLDRGADYVLRRAACIETLAQEVKRLRSEMLDASAVCACGHPDADHENRGSDGLTHDCEYDCVRTSASVCAMLAMLRADLARVTAERDQSATMAHVWESRYKVTFEAATHVAIGRDALAKQRDELVAKLVELFDWSDTSYVHASLHVGNAVKNLRADMAVLKAELGEKANDATWVTTWKRVAKEAESQANAFGAELTALECDMAQLRTDLARVTAERDALRMQLTRAIPDFVARVNARAEAEMLAGRPIAGAHHRAIEAELEVQR